LNAKQPAGKQLKESKSAFIVHTLKLNGGLKYGRNQQFD
jgi:hypothetical protein